MSQAQAQAQKLLCDVSIRFPNVLSHNNLMGPRERDG
jgi:hypothetical protein